jgi:hypothetical protein
MASKLVFSKFERYERDGDSEALVRRDGEVVAFIAGMCCNVGSFLVPRYKITKYHVEVYPNGDLADWAEFKTRGEAIAYVRAYYKAIDAGVQGT